MLLVCSLPTPGNCAYFEIFEAEMIAIMSCCDTEN